MRVGVVSDALYPWHTGGKEIRYREVIEGLARNGHDVEVFTMHWWQQDPPAGRVRYRAISPRLEMYQGGRRSIAQGVRFALACLKVLRGRFDLIEADHMPYLQLYTLRLVAWCKRVPLVVTWHEYWGASYWREYLGGLGRVAALIEHVASHLPDHIVVVSEKTRDDLIASGVAPSRMTLVENGIRAVAEPRHAEDIVVFGRVIEHKRLDVALRAFAELLDRGHDLTLGVLGEGPSLEECKKLAGDLGLGDRVRFHGLLKEQSDVFAIVAGARLVLAPSEREGFGIAVGEAMSLGTPVVVSDHADNASRFLVTEGRTGEIVAAGDPAAFADAAERILAWPDRDVAEEFRSAHPELTWERAIEQYEAVYQAARVRGLGRLRLRPRRAQVRGVRT